MSKNKEILELFQRFNILIEHNILPGSRSSVIFFLTKVFYLFDVVVAFIIHGSTLNDYFAYEFYKKRYSERRKFVTFRKANRILEFFSNPVENNKLCDKSIMYLTYDKFLKRDWLYLGSCDFRAFELFCNTNGQFMVKPR